MKKEDYRKIEYGLSQFGGKEPKLGLFHAHLIKSDGEGGQFMMMIIEDENGNIKEVHKETIRFID
jgi:hypothetical protein